MGMKIISEGPDYVFGQETDDLRAIGLLTTLATLGPSYAQEQVFPFFERMEAAVASRSYGLYFEKTGEGAAQLTMPVAFITWARLSRATAVIFEKRMRPLRPDEMKSGSQLWVIDMCAPLGHMDMCKTAFEQHHVQDERYWATRMKNGAWKRYEYSNKWFDYKPDEGVS